MVRVGAPTELQSQTEQQHQLDDAEARGLGHRGHGGRDAMFLLGVWNPEGQGALPRLLSPGTGKAL